MGSGGAYRRCIGGLNGTFMNAGTKKKRVEKHSVTRSRAEYHMPWNRTVLTTLVKTRYVEST